MDKLINIMTETTTTTRPVRIFLAMEDGPLPRSIKAVIQCTGENEKLLNYVDSTNEADLVIFTEIREIEADYDKAKTYACVRMPHRNFVIPEGCVELSITEFLPELCKTIQSVREDLKPIVDVEIEEIPEVELLPDALSILVIDDTPKHITSAREGLAGHRLTTVTGYQEAMDILEKHKFDVVLTDLHLPMSSRTLGPEAFRLGELVPYGILLMIEAARQEAKFVAVVTDLNHHADPFSAAFDHYSRFSVQIEGAKVSMLHARLNQDGEKDWKEALERLQSK